MADGDQIDAFEDQLASLEAAMADTGAVTQAFSAEITKMQGALAATSRDTEVLSRGLSRGLRSAFDGLVFDGTRASDALEAVARSAINPTPTATLRLTPPAYSAVVGWREVGLDRPFERTIAIFQSPDNRTTPLDLLLPTSGTIRDYDIARIGR